MAPVLSLDGAKLAIGRGVAGTPIPMSTDRRSFALRGSLGSLAGQPPAIINDVFGAGGRITRDAVFVVAAVADLAEETLGCLVVSLSFEDCGEVELRGLFVGGDAGG